MNEQRIYLHRLRTKDKTCDGKLFSEGGAYICDTAEATPYMLKPGEYALTPLSRIIRKGNGVYALRKPIIYVGTDIAPGIVKCSAQAYDRLRQRIKKARQRGHITILVVE